MSLPTGMGFYKRTPSNPDGYPATPWNENLKSWGHNELWDSIAAARARHNERMIRWLLGLWVSEVEPRVFYGPHGAVVGLGLTTIILDAPGFENGRDVGSWKAGE